jgi:hypothetical protein
MGHANMYSYAHVNNILNSNYVLNKTIYDF